MKPVDEKSSFPQLEKVTVSLFSSIAVYRLMIPYIDDTWHYHPEYEILYINKSHGIRLVGSHIGNFSDGDLVFISPNLPHVWKTIKITIYMIKNHLRMYL
jgi:hypothetical protein